MATGSLLNLCDAVVTSRVKNGFALIRPPGHHAEPGSHSSTSELITRCSNGILYIQQCWCCSEMGITKISSSGEKNLDHRLGRAVLSLLY
jgi:Histone deacetylase domain